MSAEEYKNDSMKIISAGCLTFAFGRKLRRKKPELKQIDEKKTHTVRTITQIEKSQRLLTDEFTVGLFSDRVKRKERYFNISWTKCTLQLFG